MTKPAPASYTVYGAAGSGSVPVEAALELIGTPYDVVDAAPWGDDAAKQRLAAVNPLGQVPALALPGGELMTESAAILLWLADRHPEARLAPAASDPLRAQFLRWMVYVPAAIYSMFWVRDEPSRLADGKAAEAVITERTRERIAHCWHQMEQQRDAAHRFAVGDTLTVLDLYVAAVSRWSPGRARFAAEAPRLAEIVARVDADPRLAALWQRRFPSS